MNRRSSDARPPAATDAAVPRPARSGARDGPDADARRRRDRAIVLLLGACVAIGPLAMDIYLPSLPASFAAHRTAGADARC